MFAPQARRKDQATIKFYGSVRNFVFKAVLGILALPRQGKNP